TGQPSTTSPHASTRSGTPTVTLVKDIDWNVAGSTAVELNVSPGRTGSGSTSSGLDGANTGSVPSFAFVTCSTSDTPRSGAPARAVGDCPPGSVGCTMRSAGDTGAAPVRTRHVLVTVALVVRSVCATSAWAPGASRWAHPAARTSAASTGNNDLDENRFTLCLLCRRCDLAIEFGCIWVLEAEAREGGDDAQRRRLGQCHPAAE